MTSRYQSLVAVGGLVTALCGGCPGFPEDQGGDGGTGMDLGPAGITVSPTRIPITGNVTLKVKAGKELASKAVELAQSSSSIAYQLGSLDNTGSLDFMIPASELIKFKLGVAEVRIKDDPSKKSTVRLFLEPVFDGTKVTSLVIGQPGTITDPSPVWVGVAAKRILTLNYQYQGMMPGGDFEHRIGEFAYNAGVIEIPPKLYYAGYSASVFTDNAVYTAMDNVVSYTSAGVGLAEKTFLVADLKYTMSGTQLNSIKQCTVGVDCSFTGVTPALAFRGIASLSTDRAGTAISAIFKNLDKTSNLRAFSDSSFSKPIMIDSQSSIALDYSSMVAFGFVNSDALADLVVLNSSGIQVFLRSETKGFVSNSLLATAASSALTPTQLKSYSALAVGDVDGDGLDDVVIAGADSSPVNGKLAVLTNQLGTGFALAPVINVKPELSPVSSVAVGKVNDVAASKAPSDLVIASKTTKTIGVLVNAATY